MHKKDKVVVEDLVHPAETVYSVLVKSNRLMAKELAVIQVKHLFLQYKSII